MSHSSGRRLIPGAGWSVKTGMSLSCRSSKRPGDDLLLAGFAAGDFASSRPSPIPRNTERWREKFRRAGHRAGHPSPEQARTVVMAAIPEITRDIDIEHSPVGAAASRIRAAQAKPPTTLPAP